MRHALALALLCAVGAGEAAAPTEGSAAVPAYDALQPPAYMPSPAPQALAVGRSAEAPEASRKPPHARRTHSTLRALQASATS